MSQHHQNDSNETAAASACRDVVIRFAHRLDARRFADAAELFAVDGVWNRHAEILVGRQQILAVIAARPDTQVERHLFTTIDVEMLSPTHARATSYVLIVRGSGDAVTMLTVSAPQTLADFTDDLRLYPEGWRITARSARGVFAFGSPT